jgi:hypothetical protein
MKSLIQSSIFLTETTLGVTDAQAAKESRKALLLTF